MPLNLSLIGTPKPAGVVPVFFWDTYPNKQRIKRSFFCKAPPDLSSLG